MMSSIATNCTTQQRYNPAHRLQMSVEPRVLIQHGMRDGATTVHNDDPDMIAPNC